MSRSCRWISGGALTAMFVLMGCEHHPFDPSLPYAVPGEFETNTNTEATKISEWWKRFGSSELNEYMATVSDGNLDIAVAVARMEQSEAQADVALAALFPVLTYTDNSSRKSGSRKPCRASNTPSGSSRACPWRTRSWARPSPRSAEARTLTRRSRNSSSRTRTAVRSRCNPAATLRCSARSCRFGRVPANLNP